MSAKKEIQVGVIVLAASLVLVFGLLWLKQVRFSGRQIAYEVDFPAVSNLQTEDRVNVLGIRMGAVDGFALHDGQVRVRFHVEEEAGLRRDAEIHLTTVGIVGEKIIDILPGEGEPAPEGHLFQGVADADLTQMTAAASQTLADTRDVAAEVKSLLVCIREQGLVDSTLASTRQAAREVENAVTELAPELTALVRELRTTAAAVNALVAGPDSALYGTLAEARAVVARADTLAENLGRAGDSLASMLADVQQGEGTAGRLLRDDALYVRADSVLAAVTDLLADVKARPKRYFHVSLF